MGAVAAITRDHLEGCLALQDALTFQHRTQIADFAAEKRLPSVFLTSEYAEVGGLMSYGPNRVENYRRAALMSIGSSDQAFRGLELISNRPPLA